MTFRYKDYAHGGQGRSMTLAAREFIRRFLMHVLPEGFMRIRHYGYLANRRRREKLAQCRQLLGAPALSEVPNQSDLAAEAATQSETSETMPRCPVTDDLKKVVVELGKSGLAAGDETKLDEAARIAALRE